ncbi:MAG: class I SAM-dependent methyltransferase, partial [Nitrospinota bacterium]
MILKREAIRPGVMVDLACGTGRLANLFAAKGWTVVGVDLSKDMLALAEKNSRKTRANIKYVRGDMRKWSKAKFADLVTCAYDSLNHLPTKSDLQKVFRNVYRTLKPGGIFLFDINNQEFYENYWNGRAEFCESQDYSLVVRLS